MKQKSISIFLILVALFLLHQKSYAQQDPQDPGLPDSVLFEGTDFYLNGPPFQGELTVPVVFSNDEDLTKITVPLVWSGPASLDSISFAGGRVEKISKSPSEGTIYYKTSDISQDGGKILVGVSVYMKDPVPTRRGILSRLYFSISDTGYFVLDTTFFSPDHYLGFSGIPPATFVPQFNGLELHLIIPDIGDVNQNGSVDIVDVVFLLDYLFNSGPRPLSSSCADVNSDSRISISDVVYLVNYILGGGSNTRQDSPLPPSKSTEHSAQ